MEIKQDRWDRWTGKDSSGKAAPHKHAFVSHGNGTPFCKVYGARTRPGSPITITMQGGFKDMKLLKTTQSGFSDFHQCKLTTLEPATDRFIGTSATVEWNYDSRYLGRKQDYQQVYIVNIVIYRGMLNICACIFTQTYIYMFIVILA